MKITEMDTQTHERITRIEDAASGFLGFIAIHSTARGPAAGGCRLWHYADEKSALHDVIQLSEGMSYKNAMAGLPVGGGKAVIMGPVPDDRRAAQFRVLGRAIEACGGDYITAEDVGVGVRDMENAAQQTAYVSGIGNNKGAGGNPGPYTARGVLRAMESAVGLELGRDSLEGTSVAIQGVGSVGGELCALLSERGASLTVADTDETQAARIRENYRAEVVSVGDILMLDADIVAPCALGGTITSEIAQKMRARIIAGGANNQLASPEAGDILHDRGIAYGPDFVCNAGGITVAVGEYLGQDDPDFINENIDAIGPRVADILARSRDLGVPSHRLAIDTAKSLLHPVSTDTFKARRAS